MDGRTNGQTKSHVEVRFPFKYVRPKICPSQNMFVQTYIFIWKSCLTQKCLPKIWFVTKYWDVQDLRRTTNGWTDKVTYLQITVSGPQCSRVGLLAYICMASQLVIINEIMANKPKSLGLCHEPIDFGIWATILIILADNHYYLAIWHI